MDTSLFAERLEAVLVGVAMGDSLGLPYEGLSRNTVRRRLFGRHSPEHHAPEHRSQKSPTPRRLRQTFCFGHGMISDDTEQTALVAQAMLVGRGNAARFLRSFAWRYRIWLLLLHAGIGLASLKAGLKLWFGFSPYHSGVFSAGNGPAMRSGVIGAAYYDQPTLVEEYVRLFDSHDAYRSHGTDWCDGYRETCRVATRSTDAPFHIRRREGYSLERRRNRGNHTHITKYVAR